MADIFDKAFNYTTVKEVKATGYYPYFIALDGHALRWMATRAPKRSTAGVVC